MFLSAFKSGRATIVNNFLGQMSVNCKDPIGRTPFLYACALGWTDLAMKIFRKNESGRRII